MLITLLSPNAILMIQKTTFFLVFSHPNVDHFEKLYRKVMNDLRIKQAFFEKNERPCFTNPTL